MSRNRLYVGDQVATEDLETRVEDLEAALAGTERKELVELRLRFAVLERRCRAAVSAYQRTRLDSEPTLEDIDGCDMVMDALARTVGMEV